MAWERFPCRIHRTTSHLCPRLGNVSRSAARTHRIASQLICGHGLGTFPASYPSPIVSPSSIAASIAHPSHLSAGDRLGDAREACKGGHRRGGRERERTDKADAELRDALCA
eukprot:12036173-Alexandrium_andersonii.AAC.1